MRYRKSMLLSVLVPLLLQGLVFAQDGGQNRARQKKRAASKTIELFDGKSLEGWEGHLADPNAKTEDVWTVEDGVLICKGEPFGYLATKKSYKNFRLMLDWRWPPGKEPGNSGVLLRITGDPVGFMPKCVEAQLKHGSAGDIWAFRGFEIDPGPAERHREVKGHEQLGDFHGVARMNDAEKPPGQWNRYRIIFRDGTLRVFINGQQVNEATGCEVVAGQIGLQSEGAEIHFRRVRLVPLD